MLSALRKITLTFLVSSLSYASFGQLDCSDSLKYRRVYMKRTHNVIGLTPSKARVTNGLALGLLFPLVYCEYMDSVRINGVYANVSPFTAMMGAMGLLMLPFNNNGGVVYSDSIREQIKMNSKKILVKHRLNGMSVGFVEMGENFSVQGIQVTAMAHGMEVLNGVSITGLLGHYKSFKGVMISGLVNGVDEGKGLQLGLINIAGKMNGVQIGLWNKIGKRGLPFININFTKKT